MSVLNLSLYFFDNIIYHHAPMFLFMNEQNYDGVSIILKGDSKTFVYKPLRSYCATFTYETFKLQ